MTEALIDIGSIISIIQISEEIVKHAYYYFHTVCEAKNDILAIINVISGGSGLMVWYPFREKAEWAIRFSEVRVSLRLIYMPIPSRVGKHKRYCEM